MTSLSKKRWGAGAGSRLTRRQFLRTASVAFAAPYVITSGALGAAERPSASNRIVFGCVGMGGMGNGDMGAFLGNKDCQVVAVCDVDSGHRKGAVNRVNKHYGKNVCAGYNDFRELIARDDIDAVLIATPDHWHTLISLAAVRSGRDVYCEKPLTLTIEEGRVLSDAVKRYGRVFQTGSQQRSDHRFRFACELVRNGRIGKLHTIRTGFGGSPACGPQAPMPVPDGFDYDLWLGPAPWAPYTRNRCHSNFRWILDYSGGKMTDWGAHHNDIAQWGNGTEFSGPVEIDGKGEFPKGGLYNVPTHHHIEYTYANGVKLICSSSEAHGVRFEGTEGWVHVNRGWIKAGPASLLDSRIGPDEIHLYASHNHHANFIECVKARRHPIAQAEIGHRSVTVCHLGNISMLLGRKLRWKPDKERFVDDPEADRYIGRPMRTPWHL